MSKRYKSDYERIRTLTRNAAMGILYGNLIAGTIWYEPAGTGGYGDWYGRASDGTEVSLGSDIDSGLYSYLVARPTPEEW